MKHNVLKKNSSTLLPPTNKCFKMYAKKGWCGLPLSLISGLLIILGCNEKFNAKKPDFGNAHKNTTIEAEIQKEEKTTKRDTVHVGGFKIVAQPNEHVKEIKFRRRYGKVQDSFIIEFNSNGSKLSDEEKLQVIKQMFNLNEQVFSYEKREGRWQLMYKGIEAGKLGIKLDGFKATGSIYPEMDVDLTVNITEQEAFKTAKASFLSSKKKVHFNYEYPDLTSFFRRENKIPLEDQKPPKGELKIQYIHKLNNFYLCYKFEIGSSIDDKMVFVDAANNTIIHRYSTRLQAFRR